MLTERDARRLKNLIGKYSRALVEESWSGSYGADERELAKLNAKNLKNKLNDFINSVTEKQSGYQP